MNRDLAVKLAQIGNDKLLRDMYKLISEKGHFSSSGIAGDSIDEGLCQLDSGVCDELVSLLFEHQQARYIEHGLRFQSPQEAHDQTLLKIAGDTLFNPVTKVGTLADPSVYTESKIPVMMGPYDASATYAPGGLPAAIIDKKFRGIVIKGATFKSLEKFWDTDKVDALEQAAQDTGFNDAISDAVAESAIYGGSIIYPVFNTDSPGSFRRDLKNMNLEKDCIDRWVSIDRWNCVSVPSFIVTDADYLHPKFLFIPQAAVDVNTSRVCMIKPRPTPYWISLYNIGWAPSDFSGWIRAYFGYEITCQSIPVMAQQTSLLLYRMPLDALNATLGADSVKKLMAINEEQMAEWSSLSPKAVNMIGEVEVVDRTYTGIDYLMAAMKSNLAAQCELPEPTLWHTPNKGFSDNTTESLLKQSEAIAMRKSFLERSLGPARDALIAHTFGQDSEEYKKRNSLHITFDKPIVSTEKDLAEVGARFAASVSSFVQAGVSPDVAIQLSSQFFPTVKVTQEMLSQAKASYEEVLKNQQTIGSPQNGSNTLGRKQGNTKGAVTTTGHFTKS